MQMFKQGSGGISFVRAAINLLQQANRLMLDLVVDHVSS
jgi:hypothetical protein